jgi:hypothetical protein
MIGMLVRTQWSWTRNALLGFAAVAFLMPALTWRISSGGFESAPAIQVMEGFATVGFLLSVVALMGSFAIAALPWTVDAEARHVYPLSLPITWPQFVATRYLAGAASLVVPTLALYGGALATLAMIDMPALLQAYPGALAIRFFLASFVAYSATFALQYIAGRQAAVAALLVLLVLVGIGFLLWLLGLESTVDATVQFFFEWPGPLAVFTDPWTLIDV